MAVALVPIGLDEGRVARVPWISIAIVALNLVAFLAVDAIGARSLSLVPARGAANHTLLTHQFLHADFWHLFWNMFVLVLVVAPFLEDAWGRPFFLLLYLAGGAVAGLTQALSMRGSPVAVVGASGAICACLGAFSLRFAHRRVRMFYWALFFRGTFYLPAWLFALLGFAADVMLAGAVGVTGAVAYAAHVGGFVFGFVVALLLRFTGGEAALAPADAPQWGRSFSASRGEDSLAAGRVAEARGHFRDALARDPDDVGSLLALARLEAGRGDRFAATPLVERLLLARLAAGDVRGARALLAELGPAIDPAAFRPAAAFRAAEVVGSTDLALADRFTEAAAAAGGAIAAKALLHAAEASRVVDPRRARAFAERVLAIDESTPDLRARAAAIAEPAHRAPGMLRLDLPVRLVHCSLLAAGSAGFRIAGAEGKLALIAPDRVASVGAGIVADYEERGELKKNVILLDIALAHGERGGGPQTVLRIPAHAISFGAIHPGVPPSEAFARIVAALLANGIAHALPSPDAAAGRPFAIFPNAVAFEQAVWGRRLG